MAHTGSIRMVLLLNRRMRRRECVMMSLDGSHSVLLLVTTVVDAIAVRGCWRQ